jgi:predicted dehydrogenase
VPDVGLIGCGAVASFCHLPALRRIRGVRVVAAADVDEAALKRIAGQHPMATHTRFEDLLGRPDVDAVIISTPPAEHAAAACAAARAGKAFYLEKPIAPNREDASRITNAAAAAGVVAAIGFNRRLHPLFRQARDLLRDGAIGRVRAVQMAFCEPPPPQGLPRWKLSRADGGGALLDLASHHVDLLRWFLADDVATVSAALTSVDSEQDGATLDLLLQGGARAQGIFSFRTGYADFLLFLGERGTLRLDRHRAMLDLQRSRAAGYGPRRSWPLPTAPVAAWWLRRLVRRAEDPSYFHALRAFVEHAGGGPARTATLSDGMRSLAVILAAEESARAGRPVQPVD